MIALLLLAACKEAAPTFTEVEAEVLVPSCGFASCHGSGTGDLQLDGDGDWASLVEVESAVAAGEILVVPGDADASYLVKKLEGTEGIVGEPMPPPSGGMDAERIEMVRAWIDGGALDD